MVERHGVSQPVEIREPLKWLNLTMNPRKKKIKIPKINSGEIISPGEKNRSEMFMTLRASLRGCSIICRGCGGLLVR